MFVEIKEVSDVGKCSECNGTLYHKVWVVTIRGLQVRLCRKCKTELIRLLKINK